MSGLFRGDNPPAQPNRLELVENALRQLQQQIADLDQGLRLRATRGELDRLTEQADRAERRLDALSAQAEAQAATPAAPPESSGRSALEDTIGRMQADQADLALRLTNVTAVLAAAAAGEHSAVTSPPGGEVEHGTAHDPLAQVLGAVSEVAAGVTALAARTEEAVALARAARDRSDTLELRLAGTAAALADTASDLANTRETAEAGQRLARFVENLFLFDPTLATTLTGNGFTMDGGRLTGTLSVINSELTPATTGAGVAWVQNATTAPTIAPVGSGYLYAAAGALTWMGSAGTVTIIAPA